MQPQPAADCSPQTMQGSVGAVAGPLRRCCRRRRRPVHCPCRCPHPRHCRHDLMCVHPKMPRRRGHRSEVQPLPRHLPPVCSRWQGPPHPLAPAGRRCCRPWRCLPAQLLTSRVEEARASPRLLRRRVTGLSLDRPLAGPVLQHTSRRIERHARLECRRNGGGDATAHARAARQQTLWWVGKVQAFPLQLQAASLATSPTGGSHAANTPACDCADAIERVFYKCVCQTGTPSHRRHDLESCAAAPWARSAAPWTSCALRDRMAPGWRWWRRGRRQGDAGCAHGH